MRGVLEDAFVDGYPSAFGIADHEMLGDELILYVEVLVHRHVELVGHSLSNNFNKVLIFKNNISDYSNK